MMKKGKVVTTPAEDLMVNVPSGKSDFENVKLVDGDLDMQLVLGFGEGDLISELGK